MQCKDIPDEPVLRYLAVHGGIGCTAWRDTERSVLKAMPEATPDKLARAKMTMLKRRGLVDGCDCGCRGDWELTETGRSAAQKEA